MSTERETTRPGAALSAGHRERMEGHAERLKALAHPLRLCLLSMLCREDELCVTDFCLCMPASQPLISKHLNHLRCLGILASEARGTRVYYRLEAEWARAILAELDRVSEMEEGSK